MRRVLLVASAAVFLDTAFYSAIAPLLPQYSNDLGLTEGQSGALSACYAVGTVVGSLPAGLAVSRYGSRRMMVVGLLVLGASSAAFGSLQAFGPLVTARLLQGIAGGLIWAASFSWIVAGTAREQRGATIGAAFGFAVGGALVGPALGALAGALGTQAVFGSVLFLSLALVVVVWGTPVADRQEPISLLGSLRVIATPAILRSIALVTIPSAALGGLQVLAPLRLGEMGAGTSLIAAGFIAGAACEAVLAPLSGRLADRAGWQAPYLLGIVICAAAIAGFAAVGSLPPVFVCLLLASVGVGLAFTPALTLISSLAERISLPQGVSASLSGLAWALGQVLGGLSCGVLAQFAGNAAPSAAIVVGLAAAAALAARASKRSPDPGSLPGG